MAAGCCLRTAAAICRSRWRPQRRWPVAQDFTAGELEGQQPASALASERAAAEHRACADQDGRPGNAAPPPGLDLNQVSARKNLNETAFFFPQLVSDSEGRVKLDFTMPEALTKWKFLGFAHDKTSVAACSRTKSSRPRTS